MQWIKGPRRIIFSIFFLVALTWSVEHLHISPRNQVLMLIIHAFCLEIELSRGKSSHSEPWNQALAWSIFALCLELEPSCEASSNFAADPPCHPPTLTPIPGIHLTKSYQFRASGGRGHGQTYHSNKWGWGPPGDLLLVFFVRENVAGLSRQLPVFIFGACCSYMGATKDRLYLHPFCLALPWNVFTLCSQINPSRGAS